MPSVKAVAIGVVSLAVVGTAAMVLTANPARARTIVVYKSPTCGCCNQWIAHLEANGFRVEARDVNDLGRIKAEVGITSANAACHTALIDGYVIEGHVPADVIARLLDERPDIAGLSVPGMPMGSPGMEGPRREPYHVYALARDGSREVYAAR